MASANALFSLTICGHRISQIASAQCYDIILWRYAWKVEIYPLKVLSFKVPLAAQPAPPCRKASKVGIGLGVRLRGERR